MREWVVSVMESMGYIGIALLMFLENIVPPIPSEVIMPAAGFTAREGGLSFTWAVVAGSIGSILGTLLWYYAAKWVGPERLKRWADRYGKWLTIDAEDIDRATAWFDRWGVWAVLFCRCVPGVRTLISVPAGFARMPLWSFLLTTAIGTVAWTLALAWVGWILRDNYEAVEGYLKPVSIVVFVGLALWLAAIIVRRWRTRPAEAEGAGNRE